jgi:N-acetylglucosamine-6-phosphate deacetylase
MAPLLPRTVTFQKGRIVRVDEVVAGGTPSRRLSPKTRVVDGTGMYLIPGMIDLQLNDMAWFGQEHTMDENVDRLHLLAMKMWAEGCTSYVLASLASPWDELLQYLSGMNAFRTRTYQVPFPSRSVDMTFANTLLGAMVEGTFMNPRFRGCHNEAYVLSVVPGKWEDQLKSIMETGSIFAVNVAPECNPVESLKFIDQVKNRYRASVAIGHCQPTGKQVRDAVEQGVDYVVHLGNGATGHSWKKFFNGGMLEECLRNDKLHVTIIGDGFHVDKHYVRDWIQRKELHRATLVTDR